MSQELKDDIDLHSEIRRLRDEILNFKEEIVDLKKVNQSDTISNLQAEISALKKSINQDHYTYPQSATISNLQAEISALKKSINQGGYIYPQYNYNIQSETDNSNSPLFRKPATKYSNITYFLGILIIAGIIISLTFGILSFMKPNEVLDPETQAQIKNSTRNQDSILIEVGNIKNSLSALNSTLLIEVGNLKDSLSTLNSTLWMELNEINDKTANINSILSNVVSTSTAAPIQLTIKGVPTFLLQATIKPSSTTSKIKIVARCDMYALNDASHGQVNGAIQIKVGSRNVGLYSNTAVKSLTTADVLSTGVVLTIDSPSTTSPVTYQMYGILIAVNTDGNNVVNFIFREMILSEVL